MLKHPKSYTLESFSKIQSLAKQIIILVNTRMERTKAYALELHGDNPREEVKRAMQEDAEYGDACIKYFKGFLKKEDKNSEDPKENEGAAAAAESLRASVAELHVAENAEEKEDKEFDVKTLAYSLNSFRFPLPPRDHKIDVNLRSQTITFIALKDFKQNSRTRHQSSSI